MITDRILNLTGIIFSSYLVYTRDYGGEELKVYRPADFTQGPGQTTAGGNKGWKNGLNEPRTLSELAEALSLLWPGTKTAFAAGSLFAFRPGIVDDKLAAVELGSVQLVLSFLGAFFS